MAKVLGADYSSDFSELLPMLVSDNCAESKDIDTGISSVACLAASISALGPKSIVHLPKFAPVLSKLLQKGLDNDKELQVVALLKCAHTMITTLPRFITPYLVSILAASVHKSCCYTGNGLVVENGRIVRQSLSKEVPVKSLIPALFKLHEEVMRDSNMSLKAYFEIVGETTMQMKPDEIATFHKQLYKFFVVSLDGRGEWPNTRSEVDVFDGETMLLNAFVQFVMKMNESMFKPLFLNIVEWGTNHALQPSRRDMLYKVCNRLLDTLKSLFAPYMGYLVGDMVITLSSSDTGISLLTNILAVARKTFLYDVDNYINEDHYRSLCDPLVNQLSALSNSGNFIELVDEHLIPCLGQLAVSCSHQSVLKQLNHSTLMQTRSPRDLTRLMALKTLEEFYSKMGEEFLAYLPETVPFLAELMEDECEEVEAGCRKVIKIVEGFLGESLQEHLK